MKKTNTNRFFRILPVLLAVLMVFGLASCGSGSGPSSTAESVPSESIPSDPGSLPDSAPDSVPTSETSDTLRLMTFNLRYDTTSHMCMSTAVRGEHLMTLIDKYTPDSISFNEATDDWMNFLRDQMKERNYDYVGVGRDAGKDSPSLKGTGNEHAPVFYRSDKFELIDSGDFWLSTTPSVKGSVSWNSACTRICSFAVLKNRASGEIYAHFATHLDHVSEEAQHHGVRVIETHIREVLEKHGNIGVVLSGDFNSVRFDSGDPSYNPVTYNLVTSFMDDSRAISKEIGVDGATFNGYPNPVEWENGHGTNNDRPAVDVYSSPIDYIFLRKGAYEVDYYTVVDDLFTFTYRGKTWHNHPVSDHYGVFCEARMTGLPGNFVTDEGSVTAYPAKTETGSAPAQGLTADLLLTADATITSGLPVKSPDKIGNLLSDDDSPCRVSVSGKQNGYWVIEIALPDLSRLSGFTFTTGEENTLPAFARLFVSDSAGWSQVGATIESLTAGTTYSILPEEELEASRVRLILADCDDGDGLVNVGVYGTSLSTGRIPNSSITLIDGPKPGEDEGYEKLFDGDPATKFYIRLYNDKEVPKNPDPVAPILFSTGEAVTIRSYTLTNGNDTASYPGRIPRQWSLYGSVSGADYSYVLIDRKTTPAMSTENLAVTSFTVDNPGSYQYYKLVFDIVGTTGNVQFSEIAFYEK